MEQKSTLILRIPSSLHARLKRKAQSQDQSLNRLCLTALKESLSSGSKVDGIEKGTPGEGVALNTGMHAKLLDEVCSTFKDELAGLVLFGSLARGDETDNSDVDLAVILKASVLFDRDIYSKWRSKISTAESVEPLFLQLPAFYDDEDIRGVWFELALDGIVLFDLDLGVSRYLSKLRRLIASGAVRRMTTYGVPYWVHSPDGADDKATKVML